MMTEKDLQRLQSEGKIKGFFAKPKGKKKAQKQTDLFGNVVKSGKRKAEEFHLQKSCVCWFDLLYPELKEDAFHVPNQAVINDARIGALLKSLGRRRGIWDFLIMQERHGFHGLWLEFKVDNNDLTPEQQSFYLRNRHRFVFAKIKSIASFEKVIEWYLGKSKKLNQQFK